MTHRVKTPIAIVLIVLGVAGFAYQGVRLMTSDAEPHRMPLPPVIGVVALIVGIALLLMDDRESRHRARGHNGPGPPRANFHGRSS